MSESRDVDGLAFRYCVRAPSPDASPPACGYDLEQIRDFLAQLREELVADYCYLGRYSEPEIVERYREEYLSLGKRPPLAEKRGRRLLPGAGQLRLPRGSSDERQRTLMQWFERRAQTVRTYLECLEALQPLFEEAFLSASEPGEVLLVVE